MKVEKRDGSTEKRILIGMIVDTIVLGKIAPKWEKGAFRSKWSNLVGSWCVEYYNSYGKAPGKAIQALYETWAEDNDDRDTTKLVEGFLTGLSGEYKSLREESNTNLIIDHAKKHFNKIRALRVAEGVQGDVDSGDVDKALERIKTFSQVEMGHGECIDFFLDKETFFKSFDAKAEPLIKYPGDLGRFFGNTLSRDSLVSFMAPEKRGKSTWLLDMAWRSCLQRRKTLYISLGDFSLDEVEMLLGVRAARHPLEPDTINYPILLEPNHPTANVEFEERKFKDGLSRQQGWNAVQRTLTSKLKTKRSFLKVQCYPNSSMNVQGINAIVKGLEREDWTPDVLLLDYADILAPLDGRVDSRHQIDASWRGMKALTQVYHCLVVTATQSDADSYDTYLMSLNNFSEDKRKYAHVNGMIGLNATEEEKELGLMRLNWLQRRGAKFNRKAYIHVAGCMGLGNPCIKSTF